MSTLQTIYSQLPDRLQNLVLNTYLKYVDIVDDYIPVHLQQIRQRLQDLPQNPKVVYMIGMPRCGTSLSKNFLGAYPGLEVLKFQEPSRDSFRHAWQVANQTDKIVIDKATWYIQGFRRIYAAYGRQVAFYAVVRDPRDELTSLLETDIHPGTHRDEQFWPQWAAQYGAYLHFAAGRNDPAHWYLIRYEDLVRWPVQAKLDFLRWLGLPLGAEPVTAEYEVIHEDDDQDWKVAKQRTVSARSLGRWQSVAVPERQTLFRHWQQVQSAAVLMQQLGYTSEGVADQPLSFEGVTVFRPQTTSTSDHPKAQRTAPGST